MSFKALSQKIHAKWLHETQTLPYWFRWLDTEAPIVASKYRDMLRIMWVYWLPSIILFAISLKLSKLIDISANLSTLAFATVCVAFGLIVFLPPGIAMARIGITAFHWNRNPTALASQKTSFLIALFSISSAFCILATASFIGIAIFALVTVP